MKERPLTELRRPAHSSAVLRLAIRSLERNMPLARRRVYVYPGASAKNTLPPFALPAVAVRRVALRDLPSNTAAAALQARTALESRTSCALSSLVFPVAQPRSSFRSLRVEPLLLAHAGQTYTTPECLHFALCTFGTLLRTVRLNLSTPMICCFARVATLLNFSRVSREPDERSAAWIPTVIIARRHRDCVRHPRRCRGSDFTR